ncbi:MAG: hypothetical protein CM15mP127_04130 [Gammaproteobacteria bacterium]|nr:MAG: hypothetical protein CM15mP127_04130 [Gammaproteobacteria bacterium]
MKPMRRIVTFKPKNATLGSDDAQLIPSRTMKCTVVDFNPTSSNGAEFSSSKA